jgi:hypothetical protein
MRFDPWILLAPAGLTVLGVLLTGPGMWSERWGWGWLERFRRRRAAPRR